MDGLNSAGLCLNGWLAAWVYTRKHPSIIERTHFIERTHSSKHGGISVTRCVSRADALPASLPPASLPPPTAAPTAPTAQHEQLAMLLAAPRDSSHPPPPRLLEASHTLRHSPCVAPPAGALQLSQHTTRARARRTGEPHQPRARWPARGPAFLYPTPRGVPIASLARRPESFLSPGIHGGRRESGGGGSGRPGRGSWGAQTATRKFARGPRTPQSASHCEPPGPLHLHGCHTRIRFGGSRKPF